MQPEYLTPSQTTCVISGQANSNLSFVKLPDRRLGFEDRRLVVGSVFIDDYIRHIRGILVGTVSLVNTFRLDLFKQTAWVPDSSG